MNLLDRRSFLQALAATIAAGPAIAAPVKATGDDWKTAFARALEKNPRLVGYRSVNRAILKQKHLAIEGRIPDGLRGVFYRNGPARHEIGGMRYHHWFDGDGMVHAFHIDSSGVSHIGRMVATAKYQAEMRAGRALEMAFGTALPGMRPPRRPDQLNTANINIIRHGGELLALWEGGSAYRLEPKTLKTVGIRSWSDDTKGLPFSAHPRLDRDGTLWNFGYVPFAGGALVLYRIDASGKLKDRALIRVKNVPMVHDFMITARHIVLILPPFFFNPARKGAFLDRFEWRPEKGGRALIFNKNDLTRFKQVQLPPFWVFHFANAWEDSSGIIRFDAPIYDDPGVMTETLRYVMRGELRASANSRYVSAKLDPKRGTFDMTPVAGMQAAEFPRIDTRLTGRQHRYTVVMQQTNRASYLGFNTVVRMNHDSGSTSRYVYAPHELAEEHIYAPNPSASGERAGWILGTVLNSKTGTTSLNIFNAERLQDGPIVIARLRYPLPLGLHGNFEAA